VGWHSLGRKAQELGKTLGGKDAESETKKGPRTQKGTKDGGPEQREPDNPSYSHIGSYAKKNDTMGGRVRRQKGAEGLQSEKKVDQ